VSFSVETKRGEIFYGRNIILAYGADNEQELENLTAKAADGKIKVDSRQATNVPGIWAAGQATVGGKRDVFISASEGARAVLSLISSFKKAS
jgi:thioredoxin reductase